MLSLLHDTSVNKEMDAEMVFYGEEMIFHDLYLLIFS